MRVIPRPSQALGTSRNLCNLGRVSLGSKAALTASGNLRVLRELWHQNPPAVILFFWILCAAVGYGYSVFPSAIAIPYVAAGLLGAGVVWEASWVSRHGRPSLGPPGMGRTFRAVMLLSVCAWLVLLAFAFVTVVTPGTAPTLAGGFLFVPVFAAAPVVLAATMWALATRLHRGETEPE